MKNIPLILLAGAMALAGCGSSGGTDNPPAPPAPAAPMPPPAPDPEPTFEERLEDLAALDPNECRAETPGFEALGGWLKNDGRELGRSRVWISDLGSLDEEKHGAAVWGAFSACAARSDEAQYADTAYRFVEINHYGSHELSILDHIREDGRDAILSLSFGSPGGEARDRGDPFPDPDGLYRQFHVEHDGGRDGQRILIVQAAGNDDGKAAANLWDSIFQAALAYADTELWILIAGHDANDDGELIPDEFSAICGAADPLCLYAPFHWTETFEGGYRTGGGTSFSTPQAAAALDAVWAVWPGMDILDLRNLAFDCAKNMPAREGGASTERTYSYSNGRTFTSTTNSTWGHGVLSLECLFTPNGGLQNPVTGDAVSGGIFGPVAGPVLGTTIGAVDYTGRSFGHGFARPVARENFALAATANLSALQAASTDHAL